MRKLQPQHTQNQITKMKIYTTSTIKKVVSKFLKEKRIKKDFTYHYLYIIHNIRIRSIIDKRYIKGDYLPVSYELVRKLVSAQESTVILRDLVEWGILECDNYYSNYEGNRKCKGYRISRFYYKDKWFLTDSSDVALNKKIDKVHTDLKINVEKNGRGYQIVNYWLNELEVNVRGTKRFIDSNNLTEDQKVNYNFAVNMIDNKKFFSVVDENGRRMHTNLSSFPSVLRKYLSIDNKDLWNVDIANSQPLFLGLLMKDNKNVNVEELNKFLYICEKGMFYEEIAKMGNFTGDLRNEKVRKEFKQKIFQGCLFDRNRAVLSKWEEIFCIAFPTIFEEIRRMKSKDYKALALALQKTEAEFIYQTITFIDEMIGKNEAILLTIHDSIVSSSESIYMVEQCMLERFNKIYNINPILTPKKL